MKYLPGEIEKLRYYISRWDDLSATEMVRGRYLLLRPEQDPFTMRISLPELIPNNIMAPFLMGLRPFMYKEDFPYFESVCDIVFRGIRSKKSIGLIECDAKSMFNGNKIENELKLAREHLIAEDKLRRGDIDSLGFGTGWICALSSAYLVDFDYEMLKVWLYGGQFHSTHKELIIWKDWLAKYGPERCQAAILPHLKYKYDALTLVRNAVQIVLRCIDKPELTPDLKVGSVVQSYAT
ncbi:hypothetical protein ACLBYF_22335 [Methylobacterium brachiatum]